MNTEGELSPLESLGIIEEMIQKAKRNFADNGFIYLLWGYTIFTCSLLHFIGIYTQSSTGITNSHWVWLLVIPANLVHFGYQYKRQKVKRASTYAEEIIGMFWLCLLAGMIVISTAAFVKFGWANVYPFLIMLYGIPTFLSGYVMKFKPLIIGGVVCWLIAIVALFASNGLPLLLLSLAVLVAWIIPGHLLQKQYCRNTVKHI